MTAKMDGLPEGLAGVDLEEGSVHLRLDSTLYPLDAVYGASFTFLDRCYVFLDRPGEDELRVLLSPKDATTEAEGLRAMAGEFANELLTCAWRHRITTENRASIEAVTSQAIAAAMGPPSLDELEDFDFSEEPFEDPLGIAMSWEEKYRKKGAGGEAQPGAAAGTAAPGGDDPQ